MSYINLIKKEWKPRFQSLIDDRKAEKDPNFFKPTGTQVYCGRQGSGKTISAVKHVLELKKIYPLSILVTNLKLKGMKARRFDNDADLETMLNHAFEPTEEYIYFESQDELHRCLVKINNDKFGVIYLIDEIHTYFNALNSKNTPMFVFTEISQQRKQRKCIIGTSQLFLRMEKAFREQCDNLIVCKTLGGFLTIQTAFDGMTLTQNYDGSLVGTAKKVGWFWHTRKVRDFYDTYQKVVSGVEQYEQVIQLNIEASKKTVKKLGR